MRVVKEKAYITFYPEDQEGVVIHKDSLINICLAVKELEDLIYRWDFESFDVNIGE